jgi:hypothetical protein
MAFSKRGITRIIQRVYSALNTDERPISVRGDRDAVKCNPEITLLMPLGFSIQRTLNEVDILRGSEWWRKTEAYRRGKIYVVDGGNLFTRLGSKLVNNLECLANLIHPSSFKGVVAQPVRLT